MGRKRTGKNVAAKFHLAMEPRTAKAMIRHRELLLAYNQPEPPPNWTPNQRKRLNRILKLTLDYLRREEVDWQYIAKRVRDGKPVRHQYVSQLLAEGLHYLIDHGWLKWATGKVVSNMDGKVKRTA